MSQVKFSKVKTELYMSANWTDSSSPSNNLGNVFIIFIVIQVFLLKKFWTILLFFLLIQSCSSNTSSVHTHFPSILVFFFCCVSSYHCVFPSVHLCSLCTFYFPTNPGFLVRTACIWPWHNRWQYVKPHGVTETLCRTMYLFLLHVCLL